MSLELISSQVDTLSVCFSSMHMTLLGRHQPVQTLSLKTASSPKTLRCGFGGRTMRSLPCSYAGKHFSARSGPSPSVPK